MQSLYFPHFLLITRNLNISKMFDWNEYSTQSNEGFYKMYSNHCPNIIILCRGEDELLQYDNVLNWSIVLYHVQQIFGHIWPSMGYINCGSVFHKTTERNAVLTFHRLDDSLFSAPTVKWPYWYAVSNTIPFLFLITLYNCVQIWTSTIYI
jgi:hypothetical protein